MSIHKLYDGTFDGFLSVVFECYARKEEPSYISGIKDHQCNLFTGKEFVATDTARAQRVWKGLQKIQDSNSLQLLFSAFLSGDEGIEMALYRFIVLSFSSDKPVKDDYGDPAVLTVRKASRKVMREAMRMMQFIRFQRTRDDVYFAAVSPDYDVIAMITKHLKNRFADQQWLVYDTRRDYGYYYDGNSIEEVVIKEKSFSTANGSVSSGVLQEEEVFYRTMWQNYCAKITIRERLNLKLQRQHMPKRYWKFLPEKAIPRYR